MNRIGSLSIRAVQQRIDPIDRRRAPVLRGTSDSHADDRQAEIV
jgi:hypothetical protein